MKKQSTLSKFTTILTIGLFLFLFFTRMLPINIGAEVIGYEQSSFVTRIVIYICLSVLFGFAICHLIRYWEGTSEQLGARKVFTGVGIGFFLIALLVIPIEYTFDKRFVACYGTTGTFEKYPPQLQREGQTNGIFHRNRRGGTQQLYVTRGTQCPDRDLFMYWYDEFGSEFTSFTSHPAELNETVPVSFDRIK